MAVDAVPTTRMSPLDCTASALGLLMPSVKNAALVTPISVPLDMYRTRAKSSSLGTPLPSPVTTAMLPLDCSIAVSGLTLTPPKVVVTVPPVPKVGSRLTEITPSSHTYERSTLTPIVSASFLLDPLTDTGRTILGLDAMCFAARGKLHGISILREYVFQIQN